MTVVQVVAVIVEVVYLISLVFKTINNWRLGICSWEQGVHLFSHFVAAGIVIGMAVGWLVGKWG